MLGVVFVLFFVFVFVFVLGTWWMIWPSNPKNFRVTQVGDKFYVTVKKLGVRLWYCSGYDSGFGGFYGATAYNTPQDAEKFIETWVFEEAKLKDNLKHKQDI